MTGKTHRVGGAVVVAIAIKATKCNVDIATITMIGSLLGSLLPDIDHPQSTISRKLWFISWPLVVLRKLVKVTTSGLSGKEKSKINGMLAHRGITHSLLACVCMGICFVSIRYVLESRIGSEYINYYIGFAFGVVIGMISHLLLDMLSNGVPLLCPISNKRIGVKWIKTGSIAETAVCIMLVLILICLIGNWM